MNLIDLPASDKKDIMSACEEAIKMFEKQNKTLDKEQKKDLEKFNMFNVESSEEDEIDDDDDNFKVKVKKRQSMAL